MKTKLLILSFFLSINLFGQSNCSFKIMTPEGTLTDAKFYVALGHDTIVSVNGILTLDDKLYNYHKNDEVLISFIKKSIIIKLYEELPQSQKPTKVRDLCGRTFSLTYR